MRLRWLVLPMAVVAIARAGAQDSVRVSGRAVDAITDAPIDGVSVLIRDRIAARTGADGRFSVIVAVADTMELRRLGYRGARVAPRAGEIDVRLAPVAASLAAVRVREEAGAAGRLVSSANASTARAAGSVTAGELAARLPFVTVRSAPGRSVVSVRGARPEQVAVTFDGVSLNDPASGAADLSDLPLAAVDQATVVPGAGSADAAPGASGGVIAFNSGDRTRLATSAGSYGARSIDGAWAPGLGSSRLRIGGAWSAARNDFTFRNTAAAPPADTIERRVNDDVTRVAAFGSLLTARVQLVALASRVDRGLVGPMNVRAFDSDRGRTRRALARAVTTLQGWAVGLDGRALDNAYHDPAHPGADAQVWSAGADADAARALGPVELRLEAANDRVGGTLLRTHDRPRGAAAVGGSRAVRQLLASASVRLDAIRGAGSQLSPSLSLERPGRVTVHARWSQSFRPPSFYDIYLASPQRVSSRELDPERVVLDAELGATISAPVQVGAALFVRRTRNAIVWFPGNVGWAPTNVPDERVAGAELRAAAAVGPMALSGWAAAYHTRLWDGFAATRTPYVPVGEGGGRATLTARRWTVSFATDVTGRRPFVSGPPSPSIELPTATVLSAYVVRHFDWRGRVLDLSIAGNDLTDTHWESVRRYPTAGRTLSAGLTLEP